MWQKHYVGKKSKNLTLVYWEINLKTDAHKKKLWGSWGLWLIVYTNFSTTNWWCHFICQSVDLHDTWLTKKWEKEGVELGWCALCSLSQQAFAMGQDENNLKRTVTSSSTLLFNCFLLSASCSSEWSRPLKGSWTVCCVRDVSLSLLAHYFSQWKPHMKRLISCLRYMFLGTLRRATKAFNFVRDTSDGQIK